MEVDLQEQVVQVEAKIEMEINAWKVLINLAVEVGQRLHKKTLLEARVEVANQNQTKEVWVKEAEDALVVKASPNQSQDQDHQETVKVYQRKDHEAEVIGDQDLTQDGETAGEKTEEEVGVVQGDQDLVLEDEVVVEIVEEMTPEEEVCLQEETIEVEVVVVAEIKDLQVLYRVITQEFSWEVLLVMKMIQMSKINFVSLEKSQI